MAFTVGSEAALSWRIALFLLAAVLSVPPHRYLLPLELGIVFVVPSEII